MYITVYSVYPNPAQRILPHFTSFSFWISSSYYSLTREGAQAGSSEYNMFLSNYLSHIFLIRSGLFLSISSYSFYWSSRLCWFGWLKSYRFMSLCEIIDWFIEDVCPFCSFFGFSLIGPNKLVSLFNSLLSSLISSSSNLSLFLEFFVFCNELNGAFLLSELSPSYCLFLFSWWLELFLESMVLLIKEIRNRYFYTKMTDQCLLLSSSSKDS